MSASSFILDREDRIHAPASADPVCQPPTRKESVRSLWSQFEPPKDGRAIVAIGRVLFQDTLGEDTEPEDGIPGATVAGSDPFVALIEWIDTGDAGSGWHYGANGLSVRRTLEDEVKIDFWLEDPR